MIVCLGWGSLIWNPDSLPIHGKWEPNGPEVPVEYLRQSSDGRLTLVIDKDVKKSIVLWARMRTAQVTEARESLRMREGRTKQEYIGSWRTGEASPEVIPTLAKWANEIKADVVIWTALPTKFHDENHDKPTYQEALEYLKNLPPEKQSAAEEYVRRTPLQIRTPYRESFERDLGWRPL